MSEQHTPGRLKIGERQRGIFVILEKIDECPVGGTFSPDDARRLAACWNACEGLTTEHLENIDMLGETLAGRFSAFHASERELMDTRDELLAALKQLDEQPEHTSSWLRARAAIAKAEGKA